jgi:hypothetical protein
VIMGVRARVGMILGVRAGVKMGVRASVVWEWE